MAIYMKSYQYASDGIGGYLIDSATGRRVDAGAYTHAVICAYDGPHGPKGHVLSRHASRQAAEKHSATYTGGWTRVVEI